MSLLSAPQQAELEKPRTSAVYSIELEFASGTSRLCNFNQTYSWGGYDWSGLGQILRLGRVEEAEGADPRALTISLAAAQPEWLAAAIGPVEEYRGLPVKMYMAPANENYQLVGTPALCWRGIMDTVQIGIDGDEGGVDIKCETAAYALKRRPVLRINSAQHKRRYPGETGLDYLNDLISKPQTWLSRRFQAQ